MSKTDPVRDEMAKALEGMSGPRKIPLLCLVCGNAVLTPRDDYCELNAAAIAMHGCNICDDSGENNEIFYLDHIGRVLSFGQWMDEEERAQA